MAPKTDLVKQIERLHKEGLTPKEITDKLHPLFKAQCPEWGKLHQRVRTAINRAKNKPQEQNTDTTTEKHEKKFDVSDNSATFEYKGTQRITNLQEALTFSKVDLNEWEVERHVFNSWEVTMKGKTDNVITSTNYQVKIWFRRPQKSLQVFKSELLDSIKAISPAIKTYSHHKSDGVLLEIDIFDPHFGKLAWEPETGEDYDLAIAEERYFNAVYDLLEKASNYKIKKILYPIGNDFFHYDNLQITTTGGTRQDSDSRWQKMFRKGSEVAIKTADILSKVAPVDILHCPSNHDEQTGFYLAEVMGAYFRNNTNVHVDNSVKVRKYYRFGKCGIGFAHGHNEKHADLPLIMMRETQKEWHDVEFREWHLGHYHTKRNVKYLAFDSHKGIEVRILRSLSAPDAWHYAKGYVQGLKGAEAFIWDAEHGNIANLSSILL